MSSFNFKNRRLQQQLLGLRKHEPLNTSYQKASNHPNPYSDNKLFHKVRGHLRHKSSLAPIVILSPFKNLPSSDLSPVVDSKIAPNKKANDKLAHRKQILSSILNGKSNTKLKPSLILEALMKAKKKFLSKIIKEKNTNLSGKLKLTAMNFHSKKLVQPLKDIDVSLRELPVTDTRPESRYDTKNFFSRLENGASKRPEYEIQIKKMNLTKNQSQCVLLPNSWN